MRLRTRRSVALDTRHDVPRILAFLLLAGWLLLASVGRALAADAADTSGVQSILNRESAAIDALLHPEALALDTAGVESLAALFDAGGLAAIRAAAPDVDKELDPGVQFGLRPFALTTYNRVEGLRPGLGFAVTAGKGRGGGLRGLRRAAFDLAAGYGLERERWVGRGRLAFGARTVGPQIRFSGGDLILPFGDGPDGGAHVDRNAFFALAIGHDRQDYLRRESFEVEFVPVRTRAGDDGKRGTRLAFAYFARDESSVASHTDFQLVGGPSPIGDANPAVSEGTSRAVAARAAASALHGAARLEAGAGVAGGALGGDFDFAWQSGRVSCERTFPGGTASLALDALHVGGAPPYQSGALLGGDLSLRGYPRRAYTGTTRAFARLEYAIGWDPLAATRIPLIRGLRLQLIPFADAGTTWGNEDTGSLADTGSGDGPSGGWADFAGVGIPLDGEVKTSAGIGVRRDIWIPGLEALRLDAVHRNEDVGDPWSFWLRAVSAFD